MPQPGIEPGAPGSVIKRHNHEAKWSRPVRLVSYASYTFTQILIICTLLCRTTTSLVFSLKVTSQDRLGKFCMFDSFFFYIIVLGFNNMSESDYFTGDTSIDILHHAGPTTAKTSI